MQKIQKTTLVFILFALQILALFYTFLYYEGVGEWSFYVIISIFLTWAFAPKISRL
jgi:hypothetical protein